MTWLFVWGGEKIDSLLPPLDGFRVIGRRSSIYDGEDDCGYCLSRLNVQSGSQRYLTDIPHIGK